MLTKLSRCPVATARPRMRTPVMSAGRLLLTALIVLQAPYVLAAPQGRASVETMLAKLGPAALIMKDYSPLAAAAPDEPAVPRIAGAARIEAIDWTARTVSISAEGVSNTTDAPGGKLALQLWFLDAPYTGGALLGHRLASLELPESCAGGCSAISSDALAMTPPSAGTYYAAIALVAHDTERCGSGASACTLDAVALAGPQTVPPSVASGAVEAAGAPVSTGPVVIGDSSGSVSFHFNPDTVDLKLGAVTNTRTTESGSIRIAVFMSSMQYVPNQTTSGFTVATAALPASCSTGNSQLAAGRACTNISLTGLPATYPAPGTYYAGVLVEEYESTDQCADSSHFCVNDGVNLQSQVTVPAPGSTGGGDSGGDTIGDDGGGGGGAFDGSTLLLGAALLLVRLLMRRTWPSR